MTRIGRDGGDVSAAEVVLLAVPGGALAAALDKLQGTTGVKYVGTDSGHRNDNVTSGGTMTTSFNDHFPFVSQGSAPNFVFYVLHHVTTNADGTVTASADNMRESCKE